MIITIYTSPTDKEVIENVERWAISYNVFTLLLKDGNSKAYRTETIAGTLCDISKDKIEVKNDLAD